MKNRQLSLSDIQKDYISKEEFYQIAHICKETALWLIETGRVSAEKPKRKGFGYKIAKEEVERYLADRQQNPLYYLKGKRHNCIAAAQSILFPRQRCMAPRRQKDWAWNVRNFINVKTAMPVWAVIRAAHGHWAILPTKPFA